eukprot:1195815-Prorocentrum_minimum.AAC.7
MPHACSLVSPMVYMHSVTIVQSVINLDFVREPRWRGGCREVGRPPLERTSRSFGTGYEFPENGGLHELNFEEALLLE